jgi:hypothetical protein
VADTVVKVASDEAFTGSLERADSDLGRRLRLSGWDRGYQLCHPSEVLSDRRQRELVLWAARTSQSKPAETENALQVSEPHLDALALAARLLEGLSADP